MTHIVLENKTNKTLSAQSWAEHENNSTKAIPAAPCRLELRRAFFSHHLLVICSLVFSLSVMGKISWLFSWFAKVKEQISISEICYLSDFGGFYSLCLVWNRRRFDQAMPRLNLNLLRLKVKSLRYIWEAKTDLNVSFLLFILPRKAARWERLLVESINKRLFLTFWKILVRKYRLTY